MNKTILFILLALSFVACSSPQKRDETEKKIENKVPEISLKDIQGFWVNSIFIDSIVPNRTFSRYSRYLHIVPRTVEITDELFILANDTIVWDSVNVDILRVEADTILKVCYYCEDGKDSLVFKKRNRYKEYFLNDGSCSNAHNLYKGCGYVRLFTKWVFEGTYDVLLKKGDFSRSSNEVRIEDGIVSRIGQNALELFFDDYSGTIHFNRKNDALFLIRDSTYYKSYHWRFSGDTLILHNWIVNREFEDEISPEHLVGEEVLRMVKRK